MKNPPPFCFGVPALKQISDVCLKIYEVDLQTKSACVKLEFKVRILHKKVSLKVGCFKLSLDETSQRIEGMVLVILIKKGGGGGGEGGGKGRKKKKKGRTATLPNGKNKMKTKN